MSITQQEWAAVLTGQAEYFDPSGSQYSDSDMSNDYYATNQGETFPQWVRNRVANGSLQVKVKA